MFEARKLIASGVVAAAVALAGQPAAAGDSNGNFQAKLGVTGVFTDDETNVLDLNGATIMPANSAETNDTVIPTLTLTYYLNNNLAVELFCCFDKVQVDHVGPLLGNLGELADVWLFPPALTLQYHFDGMGRIKPFVGAGVQWIHYFNEDAKDKAGLTHVEFDDSFGFVLQAGVDYDLGSGWSLGVDVKKTWLDTEIDWTGTNTLHAEHDLDPLIVTANLGYRFNLSDIFGARTAAAPLK